MNLGGIVKRYREENNMTMDEFAKKSGLSKGYISMLEKNENPNTKKPIAPSMEKISQVANALSLSINDIINMLDDEQEISLVNELENTNKPMGLVELELKDLILKKYKSLREFALKINMQYSTVDAILKMGLDKANITNIIRICKELSIDTEALGEGKIEFKIDNEIQTIAAHHDGDEWTEDELQSIEEFKQFVVSKRKNK